MARLTRLAVAGLALMAVWAISSQPAQAQGQDADFLGQLVDTNSGETIANFYLYPDQHIEGYTVTGNQMAIDITSSQRNGNTETFFFKSYHYTGRPEDRSNWSLEYEGRIVLTEHANGNHSGSISDEFHYPNGNRQQIANPVSQEVLFFDM